MLKEKNSKLLNNITNLEFLRLKLITVENKDKIKVFFKKLNFMANKNKS